MWNQIQEALTQSVSRVLGTLVAVVPSIVAMFLAVLVAAVFGGLVRWGVSRTLRGLRFDQRMEQWGFAAVAEWSPSRSPALLVGRLVFWSLVLLGLLIGLAAMDPTLMASTMGRLIEYLPNVFVAIILVLLGIVVARFLSRGVLIGAVNLQLESARLMSVGVKWLVLLLAIAMALDHLRVGGVILVLAFGILFGGIVLAMALAVGLGSKEQVSRTWERQANRRAERRAEMAVTPQDHL
jgi:hypothetical protein